MLKLPKAFTNQPFPTVPSDGITHAARNGDAQPRMAKVVRRTVQRKPRVSCGISGRQHTLEFNRAQEP
jgi:hypothetical protein